MIPDYLTSACRNLRRYRDAPGWDEALRKVGPFTRRAIVWLALPHIAVAEAIREILRLPTHPSQPGGLRGRDAEVGGQFVRLPPRRDSERDESYDEALGAVLVHATLEIFMSVLRASEHSTSSACESPSREYDRFADRKKMPPTLIEGILLALTEGEMSLFTLIRQEVLEHLNLSRSNEYLDGRVCNYLELFELLGFEAEIITLDHMCPGLTISALDSSGVPHPIFGEGDMECDSALLRALVEADWRSISWLKADLEDYLDLREAQGAPDGQVTCRCDGRFLFHYKRF